MRILIIGKNGQLGRSIQKIVNSVTKIDNCQIFDELLFVGREELDLSRNSNIDNFFYKNGTFNIIINCAAYTAVDKAEKESTLANQINNLAVKKIAKIANEQKASLIHVSTDYVFNGEYNMPYLETDAANPINVYGQTKLAGERAIQKLMANNAIIIRTSWVYSEYGNNFVKTMLRLGQARDELDVVCDQIGSPTYAHDLANVILKMIKTEVFKAEDRETEIYHYSNEGQTSWYEFAKEIFKIEKIDCTINPIKTEQYPTPAKRPINTFMDNNKIIQTFHTNQIHWKDSLAKCLST